MVNRISGLLVLAALLPLSGERSVHAEPHDSGRAWSQPSAFVQTLTRDERKNVRQWLSAKGIGSSEEGKRGEARQKLVALGERAVAPLSKAVMGSGKTRVRMNAAMALVEIGSSRGAAAFAQALEKGGDSGFELVVPALGLGLFQRTERFGDKEPSDISRLGEAARSKRRWTAVAATLALAKMPGAEPAKWIRKQLENMPRRATHIAATWIAAALLLPDAAPEQALGHKDWVVRAAAALALCIRPRDEARAELLKQLKTNKRERDEVRTLMVHALARLPRDKEIRDALWTVVRPTEKRKGARRAAIFAIAGERGHKDDFDKLAGWHRRTNDRDPAHGEILLALLRTDHPNSAEYAMRFLESRKPAMYVTAGALLIEMAREPDLRHANEILDRMSALRRPLGLDQGNPLKVILDAAPRVRELEGVGERSALARERIAELGVKHEDERALDLWWRDDDARAFALLHRFLPRLFELDQLVDRADPSRNEPTGPKNTVQPEKTDDSEDVRKQQSADPDEQDLNAFLMSRPYFAQRDRRSADR